MNVARLPPTTEDLARGERLKRLREHFGLTQSQVYPGKHQQVLNAEKGKNKLGGRLLRVLATRFEVSPDQLEAYANGELAIGDLLLRSAQGRQEARRAQLAQMPESKQRLVTTALSVANALQTLDGVQHSDALAALSGVDLEHGDALAAYVAARLKLRAEAGEKLPSERLLPGPDVTPIKSRPRRA